jgi:hypothetical protein
VFGVHDHARRDWRVCPLHLTGGRCAHGTDPQFSHRFDVRYFVELFNAFYSVVSPGSCAVDFFSHLEMHMRQESSPLCGRDQLSYRSSYFPVKEVVDGDMCEMFTSLPHDKQRMIAEELDRWVPL